MSTVISALPNPPSGPPLAESLAELSRWMREPVDDTVPGIGSDAINDGIESLWQSLVIFQLSLFFQGPVNVSFANATERVSIASVADPLVAPVIGNTAGGTLAQHTLFGAYTLATESGTETLPSPPSIATVIPINTLGTVPPPTYVSGAMGWNFYAGDSVARLSRQNDEPLLFSQSWQELETGIIDAPDLPLPPVINSTADNIFYIRHLELKTTDGTFKSWNQTDIDSMMMRRAGASLASSSPYQSYVWDLVNQTTIEVRPPLGAAEIPRMFFINKPRRLRFRNSPMPFLTVPYAAFIRFYALSLIKLTVDEYDAAAAWGEKAEAERARLLKSVLQMGHGRDKRITPFLMR